MKSNDMIILALAGVAVYMLLRSKASGGAGASIGMLDTRGLPFDWRIDGSQQDQMLDEQLRGLW